MRTRVAQPDFGHKVILGLAAMFVVVLFVASFAYRGGAPAMKTPSAGKASEERMAKVQKLMEHLKHSPDDASVVASVAEEFSAMNDWPKAETFWRRAAGLDAADASFRFHLAVALLQQDKYQEAIPELEKTIEIEPKNAVAHYYLGMIHKEILKSPEAARKHLQTVIDLKPEHGELVEDAKKALAGL